MNKYLPEERPPSPAMIARAYEVARAYDNVAGDYDTTYTGPKDIAENAYVMGELLAGGYVDKRRVLDVGCGTGLLLDALPQCTIDYTGIDLSPGMLEVARRKHTNKRFYVMDMQNMRELPAGSFDTITCLFEPFNYCTEPDRFFVEARRLLSEGGRVFLMSGGPRLARRSLHCLKDKVPRTYYTPRELHLLMAPWFESIEVRGMGCVLDNVPRVFAQSWHNAWARAEAETIGRYLPSACIYHIVTATKL